MVNILKRNIQFVLPYFTVLIFCLIIMLLYSKSSIHIAINQSHNRFFDIPAFQQLFQDDFHDNL